MLSCPVSGVLCRISYRSTPLMDGFRFRISTDPVGPKKSWLVCCLTCLTIGCPKNWFLLPLQPMVFLVVLPTIFAFHHLGDISPPTCNLQDLRPGSEPPGNIGWRLNQQFCWFITTMTAHGFVWKCGLTPLYPMVLLIIIPFLNGYI